MVAAAGGADVLIAYPIVGPNLARFARLVEAYPGDHLPGDGRPPESARALSAAVSRSIDRPTAGPGRPRVGMGRTGIAPGRGGIELYALVADLAEPRSRRPARLRRPHPRHRPGRSPTVRRAGDRGRPRLPRAARWPRACPSRGWSWAGRRPSRSTPRSTTPGRGVLAGDLRAPRRRLRRRSSPTCRSARRVPVHPGRQPAAGPAGSASTSATRPSPPTRSAPG